MFPVDRPKNRSSSLDEGTRSEIAKLREAHVQSTDPDDFDNKPVLKKKNSWMEQIKEEFDKAPITSVFQK
jgi:hypothetical protein